MGIMSTNEELSTFQRLRSSKKLAFGIVWSTTGVSLMLFGALVPLLPMYVQDGEEVVSDTYVNVTQNLTSSACQYDFNNTQSQSGSSSRIIGLLVAFQKITQIFTSPFVGPLVDKIGPDVPFFIGFAVTIASALGFAFTKSIPSLFIFRGLQGIGAAFLNTAGLTIASNLYRDDDEKRGVVIGSVMCAIPIGLALGPPFGSVMYHIGSTPTPFLTIAALLFFLLILQLCVRIPRIQTSHTVSDSKSNWEAQIRLIKDPYVLICTLLLVLGFSSIAFIEPTLPLHMLTAMCAEDWMLGVAFLPIYIGVAAGTPALVWLCTRVGRWSVCFSSYILAAVALAAFPFCCNFGELLAPGAPLGLSIAAKNAALIPIMAYLVDTRIGRSVHGSLYALMDVAVSVSVGVGPILAGLLVPVIGFAGVMFLGSGLSLLGLIPMAFLRKPLSSSATDNERTKILQNEEAAACERSSLLTPE